MGSGICGSDVFALESSCCGRTREDPLLRVGRVSVDFFGVDFGADSGGKASCDATGFFGAIDVCGRTKEDPFVSFDVPNFEEPGAINVGLLASGVTVGSATVSSVAPSDGNTGDDKSVSGFGDNNGLFPVAKLPFKGDLTAGAAVGSDESEGIFSSSTDDGNSRFGLSEPIKSCTSGVCLSVDNSGKGNVARSDTSDPLVLLPPRKGVRVCRG